MKVLRGIEFCRYSTIGVNYLLEFVRSVANLEFLEKYEIFFRKSEETVWKQNE